MPRRRACGAKTRRPIRCSPTRSISICQTSLAGPKRPQDRVSLSAASVEFAKALTEGFNHATFVTSPIEGLSGPGAKTMLEDGDVAIAAITSCTNTSNPSVLFAAGLLARKAREKGLTRMPWVKTSLAPGSQVVTDYLDKSGLTADLNALGFNTVGYGCTTCIGNSGPLDDNVIKSVEAGDLVVTAVLSGNRNFEGRISQHIKANYLASPPLVVAYALLGTMKKDITKDPIGTGKDGKPVYLKDIWPTTKEVAEFVEKYLTKEMFSARYSDVFKGPAPWQAVKADKSETYAWEGKSTYVANPPYFVGMTAKPKGVTDIVGARPMAILGDSVTTDHISPAGSIKKDSPAGKYLLEHGVAQKDMRIVTVPGALEIPLTLKRMAQSGKYDALIALGAVIRGDTYHFEIVSNESSRGITEVQLATGVPIANGILTTENDDQAEVRMAQKGLDCAIAAIEMARLLPRL